MKNDRLTRNCYEVEHIIPKKNNISTLKGCDQLDIQGNYIMAYGVWNNELQNYGLGEKIEVYSLLIFKSAYDAVYQVCHGRLPGPKDYPDDSCINLAGSIKDTSKPLPPTNTTDNSQSSKMSVLEKLTFTGLALVILGVFVVVVLHDKYEKDKALLIQADL